MQKIRMLILCAAIVLFASVEAFRSQLGPSMFRFLSITSVLLLFVSVGLLLIPALNSKEKREGFFKLGGTTLLYGFILSILIAGSLAIAFQFSHSGN
jgi:hypothetical protein